MSNIKPASCSSSWTYGPLGGAALGIVLAFGYAALFVIYATIRSSLLVLRVNPDAGVVGTVVAYFFTLAIPAAVIAAMMAVPAALVGLFTAPILKRLVSLLNPEHSERQAITIGSATCFAIVIILLIVFQRVLGFAVVDVVSNPETFLLWFALPALIFSTAGGAAGRGLNRIAGQEFTARVSQLAEFG